MDFCFDLRTFPLIKALWALWVIVNNPGHIITLCESSNFSIYHELCMEYNVIGMKCRSDKRLCSPPISIFVKSQCGLGEIMHHGDECKEKESHIYEFWAIHAVLARCFFGPKTINEGTSRRTEHRYSGEPIHRFAFTGDSRHNVVGCKDIATPESQLDNIETYEQITDASYYSAMGLPENFVQRLGLSEVRVLTVHVNSHSFRQSVQRVRGLLRSIFAKTIMSYVDFITGDFKLFANRQFQSDTGGTYIGGVVVEVLEDIVQAMNPHLEHKIKYNISSSTPPQDVFDFVTRNSQSANLDCMLFISIFYNRQQYTAERPPRIVEELCLAPDYIHNVSERPRQLSNYDLCQDTDWHAPLIVRVSAHATRNKRTRGTQAQGNETKGTVTGGTGRMIPINTRATADTTADPTSRTLVLIFTLLIIFRT